jgi:signal transduction histidine kinase
MADELGATRQREAELLANLRHDLRTPLTVIAGYATALRDGTATGPDAAKAAAAIEEEADRLARLVGEIGAIERIRSGEAGLRPEPIDVAAFLAATAARFAAPAEAAGVRVTQDPVAGDLSLAADRMALERMLGNLLSNALQAVGASHSTSDATGATGTAGPVGRGTIHLEAGATMLGAPPVPAIWLGVIDDGPGFPPGAAAKAFDRFWRGDVARSGAGAGLGLAIVRELAAAYGGAVYAENLTPHGARVGVILPRVPAPVMPAAAPVRPAMGAVS